MSPEVWLSTMEQTSDPSLAWKKSDIFKIKNEDDDDSDLSYETKPEIFQNQLGIMHCTLSEVGYVMSSHVNNVRRTSEV